MNDDPQNRDDNLAETARLIEENYPGIVEACERAKQLGGGLAIFSDFFGDSCSDVEVMFMGSLVFYVTCVYQIPFYCFPASRKNEYPPPINFLSPREHSLGYAVGKFPG